MPGTSCARAGVCATNSNMTKQTATIRRGIQVPHQINHGNVRRLRAAAKGYHTRTAFSR
jgi:hypothetical protein